MTGFLHGLGSKDPPAELVTPLRPATWRGLPTTIDFVRARQLGARPVMVLSDLWGYPGDGYNGHGPPWLDPAGWASTVRRAAKYLGPDVVWDVWNEPDSGAFWSGTPEQLLQVFAIAESTLRAVHGDRAFVIGPGFAHYDATALRRFLDGCRDLGCRIDALSWHEFPAADEPPSTIADHLREARTFTSLPLLVGEVVSSWDQTRPGTLVGYLAALERGRAAGAARACFADRRGNACADRSLGRLLVDGQIRTTSSWWATAAYARGVPGRVRTSVRSAGAAVLGARCRGRDDRAEVLLGREDRSRAVRDWTVRFAGLRALPCVGAADRLRVAVRRLPSQSLRPLERPVLDRVLRVPVDGSRATVRVPRVPAHDAVVLEVRRG